MIKQLVKFATSVASLDGKVLKSKLPSEQLYETVGLTNGNGFSTPATGRCLPSFNSCCQSV